MNNLLRETKAFIGRRKDRTKYNKSILVVASETNAFVIYSMMKIATAISEIIEGKLFVLPTPRENLSYSNIIKSFCPDNIINIKSLLFKSMIMYVIKVFLILMKTKTGDDLVNLVVREIPVGKYIYDTILRRKSLSTITSIQIGLKISVAYELIYFFAILHYFNDQEIDFVVLPDNLYRDGLIFEIIAQRGIKCIAGIDFNGISMHKYETKQDYSYHCRTPDDSIVEHIINSQEFDDKIEHYLNMRTSGDEKQHDVMRAYDKNKISISRKDLISLYGLGEDKKIILVMPHIFCDAPHGYPGMMFKDYENWLINTCLRLSRNPNINILIKEHPSASLYNEQGLIDKILERYGFRERLISKDINTKALFNCVDVLVTCGGTAAMEFPCYGIPVLIAAKSPVAHFSYTINTESIEQYYNEIDHIHEYTPLSENQIKMARIVLYTIHSLMKVPGKDLGLGSQPYFSGYNYDYGIFIEEMIQDCKTSFGYDYLLSCLKTFMTKNNKNIYNYNILKDI